MGLNRLNCDPPIPVQSEDAFLLCGFGRQVAGQEIKKIPFGNSTPPLHNAVFNPPPK